MKRKPALSGPSYELFWEAIHSAKSIPTLRGAIYFLACKVQALEDEIFGAAPVSKSGRKPTGVAKWKKDNLQKHKDHQVEVVRKQLKALSKKPKLIRTGVL